MVALELQRKETHTENRLAFHQQPLLIKKKQEVNNFLSTPRTTTESLQLIGFPFFLLW